MNSTVKALLTTAHRNQVLAYIDLDSAEYLLNQVNFKQYFDNQMRHDFVEYSIPVDTTQMLCYSFLAPIKCRLYYQEQW